MKHIIILILYSLLICGCSSLLMNQKNFSEIEFPDDNSNLIIFYNKNFNFSEDGKLYVKTHRLLKVGDNLKAAPDLLYVIDGSIEKLQKFEARILHKDGSSKKYSKGDLHMVSLSSASVISQNKVKFLPITEVVKTGDVVEMVSIHEFTLPPLGIHFSPSEANISAVNLSCTIEIPKNEKLNFKIVNDTISPKVDVNEKTKTYCFNWEQFNPQKKRFILAKKNYDPELLAAIPFLKTSNDQIRALSTWKDFGDWYLDLIEPKLQPTPELIELAQNITAGKLSDKEKMDAIFEYCQKNIRYEQVYLQKGEFIPNDPQLINSRKFGDCKDYSTLIYVLAHSIGLKPDLALCYRGRGVEFYDDIPVSQFNHMIVHFFDGTDHYWYDGTNRTGLPGITTVDLINQPALVMMKNNSMLIDIMESSDNLLSVTGDLRSNKNSFTGDLNICLSYQYAINFFFLDMYLNKADMSEYIIRWLRNSINADILVSNIRWGKNKTRFQINFKAEFPNSAINIAPYTYLSISRVFNKLFPDIDPIKIDPEQIFYFPYYNHVKMNINFPDLYNPDSDLDIKDQNHFLWEWNYYIEPGPFKENDKDNFMRNYQKISEKLNLKYKLIKRDVS